MSAWTQVTAWTLLHFLWQGAVVAAAVAIALRCCHRTSAHVRYLVACAALCVMVVAPVLTATVVTHTLVTQSRSTKDPSGPVDPASERSAQPAVAADQLPLQRPSELDSLAGLVPGVVLAWATGVGLLLLRAGWRWWQVQRIARAARALPPSGWQESVDRLAPRLGLRRAVRVVELAGIDVPAVMGWLRPLIVLPLAIGSQLPAAQVDAVLAHELAHVLRRDYVVNLLQIVAESVLFYHPAVWWLSARIREERELCCDDLAIAISGDRVGYANALIELESRRHVADMALAATDGPLLKRVRRILQSPAGHAPSGGWLPAAALATALVLVIGGPQQSPLLLASVGESIAEALPSSFRTGWTSGLGAGRVEAEGVITFSDDLRRVERVSEGGRLMIETRSPLVTRRVEMRQSDGTLVRRYFAAGIEQPWTADVEAWLAQDLPFLVRRSGVGATERVRRLVEVRGPSAALDEIRRLYTDSIRGLYFRALLDTVKGQPRDAAAALALAGGSIESSAELGHVLEHAIAAGTSDSSAFFTAVSRITSSAEKGKVLGVALRQVPLAGSRQVDFLKSAATIESNAECEMVLRRFAEKYAPFTSATRDAFVAAVASIESDSARSRVLALLSAAR
jgi:beta-lactamase regulating signal transducer with metallopeptidase domain